MIRIQRSATTRTLLTLLLATGLAAAATVHYSYDSAGRLVKVDYGAAGSIAYTYDNAGSLLSRVITSTSTGNSNGKTPPRAAAHSKANETPRKSATAKASN